MKKQEIEQVIPHRDPYLMLDSVDVEIDGEKGKGYKKLTGNEYFFEGHFPDRPVMPGVLIVEAIAQTSMVVAGRGDLKIKGVRRVKFRQTIEPDDYMEINVELKEKTGDSYEFKGEVYVDKNLVASGSVILE